MPKYLGKRKLRETQAFNADDLALAVDVYRYDRAIALSLNGLCDRFVAETNVYTSRFAIDLHNRRSGAPHKQHMFNRAHMQSSANSPNPLFLLQLLR